MRKLFVLLLLVLLAGYLFSATIDVSKPYKLTNNTQYERGADITFGGGYYWLVYGKSTTCLTEYDQTYLSGGDGPDHQNYHIYYKKATSIEGLASATEVQLMYNSAPAMTNPSLGEAWIEYYDNKIFIAGTETNKSITGINPISGPGSTGDIKLFWSSDNGTTWNKLNDIIGSNTYSQHVDMEIFNNELYFHWGGRYTCHLSNPTSSAAWATAVANKASFGTASGGTDRFFADKTNPNPANHMLYVAYLANSGNGSAYSYNLSTDTWSAGNSIAYVAYDPALTKYENNFIFLQAPWVYPHQAYLYCYTPAISSFTAQNFRVFDESCYNIGNPVTNNDVNWVSMWAQAIVDLYGASPTENTVVIYGSERNDNNVNTPRNADIYALEMNWTLGNNHYTNINTALYGAFVDQAGASSIVYDPAASGDIINVISGTYKENVIIANNHTLQGNKESIIDPDSGVAVTVNGAYTVAIQEFCIMDGLTNNGGTVDARYNYWGSPDGPGSSLVVNSGTVQYIPYYTDAAMTTLGPALNVALAYNGTNVTLTWTGSLTYSVYGTNNPTAVLPGGWSLISGVTSGSPFASSYQFFAVVANNWYAGATKIGYFAYTLTKGATTGYNYVSLCLDNANITNNTQLAATLGLANTETINYWNNSLQAWTSSTYNGSACDPLIPLEVGDIVNVCVNTTKSTVYLTGKIPASWATFDFITTSTTDMNLAFLPLNKYQADGVTLQELGADIGPAYANTISIWNKTAQSWVTACYLSNYQVWTHGTEPIIIGQGMMVGVLQSFTWPD